MIVLLTIQRADTENEQVDARCINKYIIEYTDDDRINPFVQKVELYAPYYATQERARIGFKNRIRKLFKNGSAIDFRLVEQDLIKAIKECSDI